jgi:periplasmic divalent cation tolerance protein
MSEVRFVYMTAGDREEAARIARTLIQERLAACANILAGMESLFWWDGDVQNEREVVLIAKTRADQVEVLTRRVQEEHSYDVPCVVSLPVEGGCAPFIDWIAEEATGTPR